MEAAPVSVVFAVDEKVLVGDNQHQAYVARPVRAGDDTALVRWESTGAREEVAVGDVKKIDLDAKRPRRKRRDASAAQAEASAPALREPPGKRRKKKADADDDESSSVDTTPSVAEIRAAYQREQEAARAAASDAEEDAGAEDPSSAREEIERHVKALQSGEAVHGYQGAAAVDALEKLADEDDANRTAIATALVTLVANGAAGGQERAARALGILADRANKAAIVAAGAIKPLVALVASGAADGQEMAARVFGTLAHNNAANKAAIIAAGGVEALVALQMNGSDRSKIHARSALSNLGPLVAERFSRLQSENASLKRQLAGEEDVVSLCDGEAPLPAKESSALRDAHDKQQTAVLRRVKEEKADAEGARDRNDAVAAAASTAAATAAAEAAQELEDVHEDFVNPLTLTVNALQTKIDELHALAYQVDPVAADAIKNRQN